jgi:hypothetical protein
MKDDFFRQKYLAEYIAYTARHYEGVLIEARKLRGQIKWADLAVIVAARDLGVEFETGHEQIEVLAGILEEERHE